jgi:hypothetical protein
MYRQETEIEIAYLLSVTQDELKTAGIEFVAFSEQEVAIRFGVVIGEEPDTFPWFVEVVKRTGDKPWEYALPFFESRHTAAYKGRIEAAHNDNLIRGLIDERVPDWHNRLAADQETLEAAVRES